MPYESEVPFFLRPKPLKIAVASVFGVTIFFGSYFTVEQYERAIVKTWGKVSYVADPGLGFKIPFVQSVTHMRTDIRSLQPEKKVNTYTDDNQEIDILFTIFYRVPIDKVAFVYENVQDYEARLFNLANDRLKAEMGKVKLEHFAAHRGEVRDGVKAKVKQDSLTLGVEITDFQLTDVDYTKAFRAAVEAASVQKAGVETREWERQQAEKAALTAKVTAEGNANAIKAKADGDAYALLTNAKAQAESLRIQNAALRENKDVLELRRIEVEQIKAGRWDGALPVQMLSGITPFMQFTPPARKEKE